MAKKPRNPNSHEAQIDTGGGQADAVHQQLSMGLNFEGLIANSIVGAGLAAGATYGITKALKKTKPPTIRTAPRPTRVASPRPDLSSPISKKQYGDWTLYSNPNPIPRAHPSQVSPIRPGRNMSDKDKTYYEAANAAWNIANKIKVGDISYELGGARLTAQGKLNLQNFYMGYLKKYPNR